MWWFDKPEGLWSRRWHMFCIPEARSPQYCTQTHFWFSSDATANRKKAGAYHTSTMITFFQINLKRRGRQRYEIEDTPKTKILIFCDIPRRLPDNTMSTSSTDRNCTIMLMGLSNIAAVNHRSDEELRKWSS